MTSEAQDSTTRIAHSSASTGTDSNDSGDFECNICFELAQDPVVTLCGHLYCWPCLYRWLRLHSHSHECPVCKALIQEEKLVPLYGRGKTTTDPRLKPIPGLEIPSRPSGQRPETAPPPEAVNFSSFGFGLVGGFPPFATARFSNFAVSAGFSGLLFPSLNFQFHGLTDGIAYGTASGYQYGVSNGLHVNSAEETSQGQSDNLLKMIILVVIVCAVLGCIM